MSKFLIVDNSAVVRQTLGSEISRIDKSAQFKEVDRAAPAIEADAQWRPDAVFLGMLLAGTDRGLHVLEELLRRRPERPVVVCSGLPCDHPEVVQAVSMGAFAWLAKPVAPQAVRHAVMQIKAYSGQFKSIH